VVPKDLRRPWRETDAMGGIPVARIVGARDVRPINDAVMNSP